jgi:hypothetical protein
METQLEKYEAWIKELERRRDDIAKHRPGYIRLFIALPIVSLLGFIGGTWLGVACLLTGVLMFLFGIYTVLFRAGEYEKEIAALERVAKDLREKEEREREASGEDEGDETAK